MRRFGEDSAQELREVAAKALFLDAIAVGALGRIEEGIALLNEVVRRFGRETRPGISRVVGQAREALATLPS